jgi:hypothetical protein
MIVENAIGAVAPLAPTREGALHRPAKANCTDQRGQLHRPAKVTRTDLRRSLAPTCEGHSHRPAKFARTYRAAGFANCAASIRTFGCTVLSVYTLRPSSQLIVHLNGIFTPVLPTSR